MAKKILKVGFDFDFLLFGLVSPLKDYRLCWQLNKFFGYNFGRQKDIEINFSQKKKLTYFNLFFFDDEEKFCQYYLMVNKSYGDYLIPERKNFDYLLMLKNVGKDKAGEEFFEKVKDISDVHAVFELNVSKLKSRNNLIF